MKWATRAGIHVDRAACAWLIRRFIDTRAEFAFVTDPADTATDTTAFDMRGAQLSHHDGRCSFETALLHFELGADPALEEIGHIVHEADLADDIYHTPAAAGLDIIIRGLSLTSDNDQSTLSITDRIFDGLYAHIRRKLLTGREPG